MNPLVRKEIRLLLPAWIAAIILVLVPTWLPTYGMASSTLGALLLGLALFGQEFSAGTFQQFLSQPVSRKQLWRTKVNVLLVISLSIFVTGFVSNLLGIYLRDYGLISGLSRIYRQDHSNLFLFATTTACLALTALAGGLWTTILFRQIAAAFWFALLIPLVISGTTMALVQKVLHTPPESHVPEYWVLTTLFIYSIAGYSWARQMFLRAQDAQWTGGTISLPNWFTSKARNRTLSEITTRKGFSALIWKELQLQQVSLLFAAILAVVHLAEIGLRKLSFDPSQRNETLWQLLGFFWVLWFGLPFVIGSTAVAEERKYGTLESQHCLPATRPAQFVVKIGVALVIGTFFGGVLSWFFQSLGILLRLPGEFPRVGTPDSWDLLQAFCVVSFAITFLSVFASTFTRNILQAMAAAVLVVSVLGSFNIWALSGGTMGGWNLWSGSLPILIGAPTLLVVMSLLGLQNYKSLLVDSKLWVRNTIVILGSLLFVIVAAALLYNRAWESVTPLEKRHGAPQLSGRIRPQVFSVGGTGFKTMPEGKTVITSRVFVLLPDGRLWAAVSNSLVRGFKIDLGRRNLTETYIPAPKAGIFVGSSNWVELATDSRSLVGIQTDGSLWKIFSERGTNDPVNLPSVLDPERIGFDTNWKSIAAGSGHFLALKTDGTLWGWGQNDSGQLGPGPVQLKDGVTRIGKDTDWLKVFASENTSVGVKRDGSMWKWGFVLTGSPFFKPSKQQDPIRWNGEGTDLRDYVSLGGSDLILKEEGSLWTSGNLFPGIFGFRYDRDNLRNLNSTNKLLRVGSSSDWSAIGHNFDALAGLKRNGSVIQANLDPRALLFWRNVRLSKHSDWLAIANTSWRQTLALAADGTLCSWQTGQTRDAEIQLLGPTRKPIWTANIFNKDGSN